MRIAHLILVHKSPIQLDRLLKRILSTNADIYIHLDAKVDIEQFKLVSNYPNVFFIKNRISINWGNYTLVKAILNGFEEIVNGNIEYSHINLLSGQDYPIRKVEEFENYLFQNQGKSFINYLSIYNEWQNAKERLTKYNLGDWNIPGKYIIQGFVNSIFPQRKIPNKLEPYGCSGWFVITPACVKYVLDYLKSNPAVESFFKYTWAGDELIFQTILLNSHLKDSIVNDNLRYIVFENESTHPQIFKINDADKLIESGMFFARKFCIEEDSEIFDYLDLKLK
jgi:hypothetical protein